MKSVLKSEMSKTAKLVYCSLLSYGGYNKIYPSITTLCENIGITRRNNVVNAIKELEQNNYIRVIRNKGKSSHYEMVTSNLLDTSTSNLLDTSTSNLLDTRKGILKGIINKQANIITRINQLITTAIKDNQIYQFINKVKLKDGEMEKIISSLEERGLKFEKLDNLYSYFFKAKKNLLTQNEEQLKRAEFINNIPFA